MSNLVREFTITSVPDGLILLPSSLAPSSPSPTGAAAPSTGLKIPWNSSRPLSVSPDPAQHPSPTSSFPRLSAYGVLGLLNLGHTTYLLAITAREPVAAIGGKQVFRVQDVLPIPLRGAAAAAQTIADATVAAAKARSSSGSKSENSGGKTGTAGPQREEVLSADEGEEGEKSEEEEGGGIEGEESDGGEEAEVNSVGSLDEDRARGEENLRGKGGEEEEGVGGVVRDVIHQQGKYGRFAVRWFSRGAGGRDEVRRRQGMSKEEEERKKAARTEVTKKKSDGDGRTVIETLTPKILRSARLYFSSSGFYFSYDYDLTRNFAQNGKADASEPLWKRSDPLFFWNKHLLQPFTDGGFDEFAQPIIQGFVGQREFTIARTDGDQNDAIVDTKPKSKSLIEKQVESIPLGNWKAERESDTADLALILLSRRSIKRAGLRYLRRGIDEEGNVANSVETEQVLQSGSPSLKEKTFSLLQIRGSMPLLFKQSPYSFKPVPELFGSDKTNETAFEKHFTKVFDRYGAVHAVSLVDKHGTEVTIGEAYESRVKASNERRKADGKDIKFEWFDFHGICKGMKYENISLLLDTLQPSLASFSWTETQQDQTTQQQSGVFRTNCMDCLDRTNVVQSAIAGNALQAQLATLGLQIDLQLDPKTQWFNTLWADNGDAISRQYAGTAALKGDFTRTRKRNWTGALSDFSLTLNRYYNNIFSDYFLQTCIDYYLGNTGPSVFDDFETDMMSKDYAINMQHVRTHAIETCEKIVLENPEEKLIGAWTLSCPSEANTLRTLPFEECVLLLTDAAVYFCRMDWTTEKLDSFERVELSAITEMYKGPYVTNALGKIHLDESKNVGLVLRFTAPDGGILRKNTRSLLNDEDARTEDSVLETAKKAITGESESRFLAFKALPPKDTASKEEEWEPAELSEIDIVAHICEEIRHAALNAAHDGSGDKKNLPKIIDKSIVSAAEAKKSTGYVESLGYSLKKLVWS